MVYLSKMVILHGKLLNYQRVNQLNPQLHRCSLRDVSKTAYREVILNAGIAAWTEHKAGDALAAPQQRWVGRSCYFSEWDVGFVLHDKWGS
jgi:hypothetical protein